MDLRKIYTAETKRDVYSETGFTGEYVEWLERREAFSEYLKYKLFELKVTELTGEETTRGLLKEVEKDLGKIGLCKCGKRVEPKYDPFCSSRCRCFWQLGL